MSSPSIVPEAASGDVYVVLDDFDHLGKVYREVDEGEADRATVIRGINEGQYNRPVRIICFNAAEGWARDVTREIAEQILSRAERTASELSPSAARFVDLEVGSAATV